MQNNHKKYLTFGVFGFLLIAAVGWYGFMHYSVQRMQKEILQLETNLQQQGFEITHNPIRFTHSLFSLEATIPHLSLQTPEKEVTWKSASIHMTIHLLSPKTIDFEIPNTQHIMVAKTTLLPFQKLTLKNTYGSLELTSTGAPSSFSFTVDHVISVEKNKAKPLSLANLSLKASHLSTPLTLSLETTFQLTGLEFLLKLPPSAQPPTVSLKAELSGFQGVIAGPHSLAEWRDGGGVLEIRSLNFTWPPLEITADGTLTVDKDLYPLGSFSSHIKGYEEGLNQLVKAGIIKEQNATMAAFFLNMLSQSNPKGDKTIKVPLTLQDRHLSLGSIPLTSFK